VDETRESRTNADERQGNRRVLAFNLGRIATGVADRHGSCGTPAMSSEYAGFGSHAAAAQRGRGPAAQRRAGRDLGVFFTQRTGTRVASGGDIRDRERNKFACHTMTALIVTIGECARHTRAGTSLDANCTNTEESNP
jgi:hypothetical protein